MSNIFHHCQDNDFQKFIESQLLYHKVVSIETKNNQAAELTLDNGVVLEAYGNQGCGGCENGWYYLTELNTCDNVITRVELVETVNEIGDDVFSIFVYAEDNRINLLSYEGGDNGYYGVGYEIKIKKTLDK